ncbi:surface protease GP63 [Trypanosoma theileri]|uniref:Leishmanolysin-like peptidase n=1 Tax=Trypanosoma theileri TaxID=67003 RepID=A0A1X0NDJ3_9TRYP|nr:surface protease GP63 [Trypanosoma theileri]ORC81009.1 surface protease GP63 [Trypanosoma theileri]
MEKHSMRHLLWAALFLLYCSCGCLAAVVQQLPQKGQSALQAYTVSAGDNNEKWEPIRFAVYTKYVEDVMNYCIAEKKVMPSEYNVLPGVRDDLEGQFKQLCDGENKMTTKRMHILFKDLLPQAIKLHRDRLKVKPVQGNLSLWKENYEDDKLDPMTRNCKQFLVPEEHLKHGIPDADFLLYVRLSPTEQDYHICTKDRGNQIRPTSARISFVPKEINATRHFIRMAARNIAFGLGFKEFVFGTSSSISGRVGVFLNGGKKDVTIVTGGNMKEKIVEQFNCSSYGGIPLDFKGESLELEWERRIARDELMGAYTGDPTGMFYTNLTLTLFNALGFYRAEFSMAEPMSWGKDFGCELFESTCQEIIEKHSGKFPKTFCKESDKPVLQCTSDRFGLGVCSKDNTNKHGIPAEYHYFQKNNLRNSEMMEGCPIIKPFQQTMCETGDETLMPGSIVSNISRCLDVTEPVGIDENGKKVKVQGICAKVKCEDGKVKVHYKGYNEENGKEKWEECSDEKSTITLQGSEFKSGTTIRCPKYEEVCTKETNTDLLPEIKYNVVNVSEDKVEEHKQDEEEEETKAQNSSSTNSEASRGVVNGGSETSATEGEKNASAAPDANGSSHESSAATPGNSTNAESAEEEGQRAPRSRRHIADATTSQSAANPNGTEDTIQSSNTVLNRTNLTESEIKEETLKHTNVTVMFGTDSSIMVSCMAPLALLVCVVGFVMVP